MALTIVLIGGAGAIAYMFQGNANPLPASMKALVSYHVLYPAETAQILPKSYNYQADQKALTFTVKTPKTSVIFTQQPAPDTLGKGSQVYYPALGLHPYAQFQSKLGPVALVKFWQSGSLAPVGQAGILATDGTILVAHAEKNLTNAEWKGLFDSLKITK